MDWAMKCLKGQPYGRNIPGQLMHMMSNYFGSGIKVWIPCLSLCVSFYSLPPSCFSPFVKATLFSAVVTAFVLVTFQDLQPSAQDLTNNLLLDVVHALKNPQMNTSKPTLEPPKFIPSSKNVWVNGLWFISLACSLGDAAIAMLIKQWLNAYSAGLPSSHQLRSRMRQHRFNALVKWKTAQIIGFLPFALSACVMVFLAGLSILLFSLNNAIAIATTTCIGVIFIFHVASLLLPGLCNSPWKTAVSPWIYGSLFPLREILHSAGFHNLLNQISNGWKRIPNLWKQMIVSLSNLGLQTLIGLKKVGQFLFYLIVAIVFGPFAMLVGVGQWIWTSLPQLLRTCLSILFWFCFWPLAPLAWPIAWLDQFASYLNRRYEYYSARYRLVYPPYLPSPELVGRRWKRVFSKARQFQDTVVLQWKSASEHEDEMGLISEPKAFHWLDGQAILWMVATSTDKSLTQHSIQSLAGLSVDFEHIDILEALLLPVQMSLLSGLRAEHLEYDKIEMNARGLWHIEANLAMRTGGHDRGSQTSDLVHSEVKMAERGLRRNSMAFVACICACRSLNEIISLLEVICDRNSVDSAYTPVHTRMMVETLAQEISRRKRTDISVWTTTRSENALDTVVVPLLVRLLSFKTGLPVVVQATFSAGLPDELAILSGEMLHVLHEYADGWVLCQTDKGEQGMVPSRCLGKIPASELNTSVAVALAILTQAVPDMEFLKYSTESQRVHDFYYLLCASLSMLLRFPEHFKSQEMIDMIYDRLVAAGLSLLSEPPRDDGHYHIVIAEIFKFAFAGERLISHDLVIALSKMDRRVYLHLSPGAIPDPTRYFVQSTPIEVQIAIGICLESLNAPTQNVVGILAGDQDLKLFQYVLSLRRSTEDRSQAFKLLLRKVHQTQRNNDKNQWKKLKLLGFLDAVQVFFSSIGSLTQSELDDWMDTLTTLCQSEGQALRESGAMKAFIIWAYQDWRGRPLMGDHMEDLHCMAKSSSLSVEDINDTSWFTDLTISKSYRARI